MFSDSEQSESLYTVSIELLIEKKRVRGVAIPKSFVGSAKLKVIRFPTFRIDKLESKAFVVIEEEDDAEDDIDNANNDANDDDGDDEFKECNSGRYSDSFAELGSSSNSTSSYSSGTVLLQRNNSSTNSSNGSNTNKKTLILIDKTTLTTQK